MESCIRYLNYVCKDFNYMYFGRHGGVVVSAVKSQQKGPRFESMGWLRV